MRKKVHLKYPTHCRICHKRLEKGDIAIAIDTERGRRHECISCARGAIIYQPRTKEQLRRYQIEEGRAVATKTLAGRPLLIGKGYRWRRILEKRREPGKRF